MGTWPNDDDGDLLRELEKDGFNFDAVHQVDFQINFERWPPPPQALQFLEKLYGPCAIVEPDEESDGYVEITKRMVLTYEGVVSAKEEITMLLKPFTGYCDWWDLRSADAG
ncbi:ribonuclease E inhibitor RraB [Geotalea sp. SG265]|uniref:ribonuclease E inhibitor RraB n=1 Tax=Geotalea sp. SG265 TaxID=2922867 RepID=UPI001FAF058C|nr:ribonuclease E inhibitor RraB [Geotalea sp. SG265]